MGHVPDGGSAYSERSSSYIMSANERALGLRLTEKELKKRYCEMSDDEFKTILSDLGINSNDTMRLIFDLSILKKRHFSLLQFGVIRAHHDLTKTQFRNLTKDRGLSL